MRRKTQMITAMMLFSTTVAVSQMKVREELPEKYKWDLSHLYATDETWKEEKERLQQKCRK